MASTDVNTAAANTAHRHPEIEHFLNLNTVLHSLVDFIRPETYIAPDELQTYNELKEKFIHEAATKRKKQPAKSPLEVAGVQSIRSTSGIYRFLAHHQKQHPSANANNKPKPKASLSREELLKKLHSKMPHRQQQAENGPDYGAKRKRDKEAAKERAKKPRVATKEWTATPSANVDVKPPPPKATPTVPNQITFGRFDFKTEDSSLVDVKKKNKKLKKLPNKQQQMVSTLKKIESEQSELARLQEENPEEGRELLRSKHWKTAMAKAKGEKVRDNAQMLRKSIKKQSKLRQRSAKKWQQKKSETDKRVKERQDKRQANLQKRKDDKQAKIKKRLIKKGRLMK